MSALYLERPSTFHPRFAVAGCFVMCREEMLLLLRKVDKNHGGTWGMPSGKVEAGETPDVAVVREIREETGIVLQRSPKLFRTVYVCYPEFDFVYHIYAIQLEEKPLVQLETAAHCDYRWVGIDSVLHSGMPLVPEQDTCVQMFLQRGEWQF